MAHPISFSVSTDQLEALVALSERGSLRAAAEALIVSEQGLRNRLLSLEQRLGVELYRKQRGIRRGALLTEAARRILPRAQAILQQASGFGDALRDVGDAQSVHIAATQYVSYYLLVDVIRRFHRAVPSIRVRLSVRTEMEIEASLRRDPTLVMAVTAPYESTPDLAYEHIFSVGWGLIVPRRHRLGTGRVVGLAEVSAEPMILFERGSTGRQHVLNAFAERGITPRVEMEATHTQIIVRMVEAGLGVSIVPLLPGGAVTRGHRVEACTVDAAITPIRSGILTRRGEETPPAAKKLIDFFRAAVREKKLLP